MALEHIIAITGFINLLFYLGTKIESKNIWIQYSKNLLIITGLVFMLLIPASFIITDFETRFWEYTTWMLRIYAAYSLICLIVWAFKKFDIKRRMRL